jgi:hypothetical protein
MKVSTNVKAGTVQVNNAVVIQNSSGFLNGAVNAAAVYQTNINVKLHF